MEIIYRFYKNRLAFIGFILIVLYLLMAVLAPLIAPYDPYEMDRDKMLKEPDSENILGTDQFGRDILSRIIHGSRISLQVGVISVGISLLFGVALGTVAGYYGKWIDYGLSRVIDVMFSFPDILLALVVMAILGQSLVNVMIAIGIVYTPIFARIARGSVLAMKSSLFVEAAKSMGVSNFTIIRRHIIPNITAPLIVQATLSFAFAILAEAALSFLGLGVEPDVPSWGIMLNDGKDWMERAWWIAVFPGIAISLAVLCFNLTGDGLRDSLDPTLRNEVL